MGLKMSDGARVRLRYRPRLPVALCSLSTLTLSISPLSVFPFLSLSLPSDDRPSHSLPLSFLTATCRRAWPLPLPASLPTWPRPLTSVKLLPLALLCFLLVRVSSCSSLFRPMLGKKREGKERKRGMDRGKEKKRKRTEPR